ncbi:hypothetical protein KY290_030899 [Solanum tuberosum]|uniref:Uncharacterized protein n=1 Tax=Solanum tuberosum TaxID=4113 RepID=A0ABQ7U991_SOLTU|nr:hypothetical protein KY285_029979 [Solanum tuberosum]KAH0742906.1 hypothetical protein KY290_030899 [Solanum tuberosum]
MLCARGGQKLRPYLCVHVSGFHTSKNFAEEERNGDARVSLARCCCCRLRWGSPVITLPSPELAARWSEKLELMFVVVVLTGAEEKRERGSPVGAVLALLLAGAAFACWREERIGGGARSPADFRGCSLAGAVRCFA